MRLMNSAASTAYVHPSEREPDTIPSDAVNAAVGDTMPNPNAGKAKPGGTTWMIRGLTSREDGALQDSIVDMSRASAQQGKDGEMKVNMGMIISPSTLRRNRVRLGIVGWDTLQSHDGTEIPFTQEDMVLGAKTFKAVPEWIMDLMPQSLISALAGEVERNSTVTPTEGNG